MSNQLEKLEAALGGKLERTDARVIPGLIKRTDVEVVYFSIPAKGNGRKQFRNITNHTTPPFAQYGGVSESGCCIKTPSGMSFYALTYHGDLVGWKRDIEEGAKAHDSILARIEDENISLSDGRMFSLDACQISFG